MTLPSGMAVPSLFAHVDALVLLRQVITYALRTVSHVERGDLSRPTPCPAWDLEALLGHMMDGCSSGPR